MLYKNFRGRDALLTLCLKGGGIEMCFYIILIFSCIFMDYYLTYF